VRERAKLRQEVNEVQTELQGTRRQLHSFMASLMQLKNSMASAGEGDLEHALELLQSSSYSASLNSEWLQCSVLLGVCLLLQVVVRLIVGSSAFGWVRCVVCSSLPGVRTDPLCRACCLLLCPVVCATDANQLTGTNLTEDEVMAQLQQMQQLSETLVQDMRQ
jgi:hypothetical protein